MNKVALLMLLAVLFTAANVGEAERVEILNGSSRVAQPAGQWQQTDVVVTTEKTSEKVVDIVPREEKSVKSETLYNPFIFYWAAAMLLMVLSNLLTWRGRNGAAATFAFACAFTTFTTLATLAAFAVFAAAITALAAALVADRKSQEEYRVATVVFYMAMVVSI